MKSKKTLTRLAGVCLLAATFLSSGCAGETKMTIAYFNADRVDKEAEQIRALEKEANEKLMAMQKEGQEKLSKLPPDTTEAEAQQIYQEHMMKMQSTQLQYQSQVRQKLDNALDEIAKEKKLDAVLANSGTSKSVIYGGLDITDDVIQKMK